MPDLDDDELKATKKIYNEEMIEKEIEEQKIIQELTEVRSEMLNEKALKLFDFIMKKLDELEKTKSDLYSANQIISEYVNQQKIIDLMAEEIIKIDKAKSQFEYDHTRIWDTSKGVKEYFEDKAKEE